MGIGDAFDLIQVNLFYSAACVHSQSVALSHARLLRRRWFPYFRFASTPLPVPDFRHVLSVLVDVLLMLDKLVLHHLLQVSALIAQLRQAEIRNWKWSDHK